MGPGRRQGITRLEVLIILAVISVLLAVLIPLMIRAHRLKMAMKDGQQIRGVHQSFLIFSREFDGTFPIPSLALPHKDPIPGVLYAPCYSNPQFEFDTTAHLFSMMVMQNYVSLELCVGTTEPSPKVQVMASDAYDWVAYQPMEGVYWDGGFLADLDKVSHVSYAHMPLHGARVRHQWRESLDPLFPVVGNRGPRDGEDPKSITHLIHRPVDQWFGNVAFNDNHVEFRSDMNIANIMIDGQPVSDHLFRIDDPVKGLDLILGFTKTMTKDGPELQWD